MAPRFKAGDLLEVYIFDQEYDYCREGIIKITSHIVPYAGTDEGAYYMKALKGNVDYTCYNSRTFDQINTHILIGNIYDNPTLKVLYGE